MQTVDYRRGLSAMAVCFLLWGFQPLYWFLCTNLCGQIDTFFLMACRIVWAAVCCLCILKVQGKLPRLWAVFRDKQVLKREIPASVLLFGDWMVYLWAVQNGRVLECSLGYYIQPLVVFALGALIFKEKLSWRHFVIIAIVVVGIVLSTSGFGGVPYVTIALALMFAVYAAIKKSLTIDSIVSTSAEILMMVPVALLFILFFRMGDDGMGGMTVLKQLLMIGGGVVTGLPMVFYAIGAISLREPSGYAGTALLSMIWTNGENCGTMSLIMGHCVLRRRTVCRGDSSYSRGRTVPARPPSRRCCVRS